VPFRQTPAQHLDSDLRKRTQFTAIASFLLRAYLKIVAAGFQPTIEGGTLFAGPGAKLRNHAG
jgi:hypothetical protein